MQLLISCLLWFSAIGCGLLAGLYFSFSTFIMTALGRIGQTAGITAMNAINVSIVQSLFMPFFLGTTTASAALAAIALFRWGEPGAMAMVAAGVLYVLGMFIVTMIFNVPLNNALAAVDPASSEAVSEPRPDGLIHCGVRAVYCRDRREIGGARSSKRADNLTESGRGGSAHPA